MCANNSHRDLIFSTHRFDQIVSSLFLMQISLFEVFYKVCFRDYFRSDASYPFFVV